jgi:hypothetical protein
MYSERVEGIKKTIIKLEKELERLKKYKGQKEKGIYLYTANGYDYGKYFNLLK